MLKTLDSHWIRFGFTVASTRIHGSYKSHDVRVAWVRVGRYELIFGHNEVDNLQEPLKKASGNTYSFENGMVRL